MTTRQIKNWIKRIREDLAGDDEMQHSAEDDLRDAFIEYVASLDDLPKCLSKKAKLVLTTSEISFARWCS